MKPYIIYGRRVVHEFFASGRDAALLETIYLADGVTDPDLLDLIANTSPGLAKNPTRRELDRLYPDINHQGVLLICKRGRSPHDRGTDWKDFIQTPKAGPLLALDSIQDPQNLGAIIRGAEALGAGAVFITGKGAALGPTVDRASAGAVFHIQTFTIPGPDRLLDAARKTGYWIAVAASDQPMNQNDDMHERERSRKGPLPVSITETEKLPPAAETLLFIGGEGAGVRPLLRKKADFVLSIPLRGRVASLNASVAAGILIERLMDSDPDLNTKDTKPGRQSSQSS